MCTQLVAAECGAILEVILGLNNSWTGMRTTHRPAGPHTGWGVAWGMILWKRIF